MVYTVYINKSIVELFFRAQSPLGCINPLKRSTEVYLNLCSASNAQSFGGSSHHVFEAGVTVFKPASIHNGGDDI